MAEKNSLYESAYTGDYEAVRKEVEKDTSLIEKLDDNGRIVLHWAALSGNVKLVTYILDLKSPVDPEDDTNATPLILAASAGRNEAVKLLLNKGASVNHKTNQGHSALQYACSKGWLEIAATLLECNADINIADIRGATPLHRAASKGNLAVVKLLLSYKDKLKIDSRDYYLNSPLHLACEEDRQEESKLLVENGADFRILNKDAQTPLDLCSIGLAKLLLNLKVQ